MKKVLYFHTKARFQITNDWFVMAQDGLLYPQEWADVINDYGDTARITGDLMVLVLFDSFCGRKTGLVPIPSKLRSGRCPLRPRIRTC